MTTVLPSALSTAAQDLTGLLDEAVIPANVIPPAADEISVAITELFNGHASWYQGLITEAEGYEAANSVPHHGLQVMGKPASGHNVG